jgi:endogenous inhibitor of DNA gyrase (YacG/DUF329 family)
MQRVNCPTCEKAYRLKDETAGKTVKCPNCGGPIPVGPQGSGRPLRARLRAELERLARTEGVAPEGPMVRVAEAHGSRGRRRPWAAVAVAALLSLAVLGGGAWLYVSSKPPARPELPQQVRMALSAAERADLPGQESDALGRWLTVRRLILASRKRPDDFAPELAGAEQRIQVLQAALVGAVAAGFEESLRQAQAALEAGRTDEARARTEQVLRRLLDSSLSAEQKDSLQRRAEEMLKDPRLVAPPAPRPTAEAAPAPAGPPAAGPAAGARRPVRRRQPAPPG